VRPAQKQGKFDRDEDQPGSLKLVEVRGKERQRGAIKSVEEHRQEFPKSVDKQQRSLLEVFCLFCKEKEKGEVSDTATELD
jgi:hypothetical protein